jgi:hypothetical protein
MNHRVDVEEAVELINVATVPGLEPTHENRGWVPHRPSIAQSALICRCPLALMPMIDRTVPAACAWVWNLSLSSRPCPAP